MLRLPLNRARDNNASITTMKGDLKAFDGPLKQVNGGAMKKDALALKHSNSENEAAKTGVKSENRVALGDVEIKCTEMADDIYRYLVNHEKKYLLNAEFLTGGEPTNKMRRILVDWLVQVHVRFHLLPETLHLSMFVLDQMLSKKIVGKNELQLLGVSSMYVASKFEEVFLPDVYDYEYITENAFNKKQILQMEQLILNNLQFDLSCPSSLVFARCVSRLVSEAENSEVDRNAFFFAYNMCKYFGELALLDSVMSTVPKSHIAMAAMYIALRLCHVDGINIADVEKTMTTTLQCNKSELHATAKLLAQVSLKTLKQNKLVAVKQKYMSPKLGQVSSLVNEEAIEKLEKLAD